MVDNVKRILVPVKEAKVGSDALRLACDLAKESKAHVYALYVIEVRQELPLDAEVDASGGEELLRRIEAVGREEKFQVEAQYIQARNAGPAIVQDARERVVDLIVLGIPYKQRFGQFALGHTTLHVLDNSSCPVVLWREPALVSRPVGG